MEPEKIQGIVQNFKNAGVSEADIKYYFDSEGVAQDAWMGFYGGSSTGEKKKSIPSSQSTSEAVSMESPSATGSSGFTLDDFTGTAPAGFGVLGTSATSQGQKVGTNMRGASRAAQEGREFELSSAISSLEQESNLLQGEFIRGQQEGGMVTWGPVAFGDQSGASDLKAVEEANQKAQVANNAYLLGADNQDSDNFNEVNKLLAGRYEEINNQAQKTLFLGDDQRLFSMDENGAVTIDHNIALDVMERIDAVEARNKERLDRELEVTGDLNEFQEVLYDMNTGVRGISTSFEGLYYGITGQSQMVEGVQYERMMDGFRRTASLMSDGLTDKDLQLGISGLIAAGEYDKARIMFNTDLAQTAPQLAMQAATTYLTGGAAAGLGFSASATSSAAMWAGSTVMGANVFGGTLADQYGKVSTTQRYLEAFAAAAVETLSERAFVGDMVALVPGISAGKKITRQEIRDAVFGKGIMSQEFLRMGSHFAKSGAKNFFRNGVEEGLEEVIAGIGTEIAFAAIEGREADINVSELIDSFIVGFGAGAGSSAIGGVKNPNLAKAALASMGVLSSNYVKLDAQLAKAKDAAVNARDEAERSKAENKVAQLQAMQAQTRSEEVASLEGLDQDQLAQATTLYQRIRNAANALGSTNLTDEQRQQHIKVGKQAQAELKDLKEVGTKQGQAAQVEREAVANFNFGETGTIEVNEKTDSQGSKFVANIVKVAKSLGATKVMLHKDYDAAAAASGQEKSAILGSSGFFKGTDGSIHLVLPAMQSNTAYHEAYHSLARNIDPKYLDNFLNAVLPALDGLDSKAKAKYGQYLSRYGKDSSKAGRRLLAEEIFAEINADITEGAITVENVGAALNHNIASVLNSALRGLGLNVNKYQSFTDFTNFMAKAAEGMRQGTEITRFSERYVETPQTKAAKDFVSQIIGTRGDLNTQELDALATAEAMLRNGKSMDDVYGATGWYQQNGQWKTEVQYIDRNAFTAKFTEFIQDDNGDYLTDQILLSDLIGADAAVLRVYPELANVPIGVKTTSRSFLQNPLEAEGVTYVESEYKNGAEQAWTEGIYIDLDARVVNAILEADRAAALSPQLSQAVNSAYEVLVHEVQHAVQTIEGFPVGGSNTGFAGIVNKVGKKILNRAIAQAKTRELAKTLYDNLYYLTASIIPYGVEQFKSQTLKSELLEKVSGAAWDIVERESNAFYLVRAYINPVDQINNTLDRLFDQMENGEAETALTALDDLVNLTRFIALVYKTEYELTSDEAFKKGEGILEAISFQELSPGFNAVKFTEVMAEIFKTDNKDEATYPLGGTRAEVIETLENNNEVGQQALETLVGALEFYTSQHLRQTNKLLDNYEIYRRLAGEVEARNAATRGAMEQTSETVLSPLETQEFDESEQIASWAAEGAGYINFGIQNPATGEELFVLTSEDLERGAAGAMVVGVGRQSADKSETGAGLFEGTILPDNAIKQRAFKAVWEIASLASEGATIMANGKPMSKFGYQVSVFDGSITPLSELQKMTAKELSDWSDAQVAGLIEQLRKYPSSAVGLWVSGGSSFFDVSVNVQDRSDAVALAKETNQLEIWDNAAGRGIKTRDAQADDIMFQINPDAVPAAERITVKGKYGSSVMRKGIPTMTFQEVVADFRAKNGRDPVVALWMGDQSGYGEYVLTDGSTMNLEGGLGHLINKDNMNAGVVWATNKAHNGIQGVLQNADIVAEVSGHPIKSSRFYKGTVEVMAREFAIAWKKSAGQTIKHGKYEITVPKLKSDNPVDAIKAYMTLVIEAYRNDGKTPSANFENVLLEGKKQGNVQYINLSEVETLDDLKNNERRTSLITTVLGSYENTKANQEALAQLGMPTEEQITDQLRDGYLKDNDFREGDIYAYYAPSRTNGEVDTAPGKHSTYQTDILGELVAVAGARQNVFDMVPAFYHLREAKLHGHYHVRVAQEQGFADMDGVVLIDSDINVAELSDKEVSAIIKRIAAIAKKRYDAGEFTRAEYDFWYAGKSGRVSTDVAADLQKMRVMNSQATIVSGNSVLATMMTGLSWEEKVQALNDFVAKYRAEGYAAADINTLLSEFYGEMRQEYGDINKAGYPVYGHSQSGDGLMFQSGLINNIIISLQGGLTEAQVRAELIEAGFSVKDANLLVAKAKGYKLGANAGRREGRKAANEIHAQRMKERRQAESQRTKNFRNEVKGRLLNMNQINDEMVNLMVDLMEKFGNVKITAAQVKAILRAISATQKKIYKKGMADNGQFALTVVALVDKLATIVEKQYTAQQIAEYNSLLRKVKAKQKALASKFKALPKTSRSPLISYSDEIIALTSLEASHLEMASLKSTLDALNALDETTKLVNASVKNGQVKIAAPYVNINGKEIDFRRSKVYFNELTTYLEIEANEYEQALIASEIQSYMDLTGADYATASGAVMLARAKKNLTTYQKKLQEIADELGLDINNVQDLELALEAMAEEKTEEMELRRDAIIGEVIVPTAVLWRNFLAAEPNFADIFGLGRPVVSTKLSETLWMNLGDATGLNAEQLAAHIEARMQRMSVGQLRRIEFAMFDYIVNGKAYGTDAIAAETMARNEGTDDMNELGMTAQDTREKKGGALRNSVFAALETTPTFFRRIFLYYSESDVAKYMNTLGFSNLRAHAAQADARHALVMDGINNMLKANGMNTAYNETALQIYSMVMQKPEKMSDSEWALAIRKQFESAIKNDNRYNKKVMKEKAQAVRDFFYGPAGALELSQIQAKLETVDKLVESWSFLGDTFQSREHLLASYAENFLGQKFVSQPYYLPFSFRKGGDTETLQDAIDGAATVKKMLDSYSASKLGKRASATFERNPDAIRTQGRYIDLNFFGTISKVHKENEVKIATSRDVAYISEMTSEKNQSFLNSIPTESLRSDVRQKIYDFMIDSRAGFGDDALSPATKNWIGRLRGMTILYYFGAVLDQIVKQSAPAWNTLMETKNFDSKMDFILSLVELFGSEALGQSTGDVAFKQQLGMKFDIADRNVRDAVISFTGDRPATGEQTRFEKGADLSTKSLVLTDKIVAGASWYAYYKDWFYNNTDMKAKDWSWEKASATPNTQAAEYASLMVAKDQNISTSRDRSKFGRYTRGTVMGLVKTLAIPFIDFLMNKKMNMIIDVQKGFFGEGIREEAARSAAGTLLEITHFNAMAWMVLAPLYTALGVGVASLFGADDDEAESWFSEKFGWDMFLRGMYSDMNPYLMPIQLMEDGWVGLINYGRFLSSPEFDSLMKTYGDFGAAYETWSKTDAIPSFGAGRKDQDFLFRIIGSLGPIGNIAGQYAAATGNIATLQADVPYYTTATGTVKYLTQDEADRMLAAELFKLSYLTTGFATGIMAKEVNAAVKGYERTVTKRSTTNENEAIDRLIAEEIYKSVKTDGEAPTMEALWVAMAEKVAHSPQSAEAFAKGRVKGIEKQFAEMILKDNAFVGAKAKKHFATARDIDARFKDENEMSFVLQRVANSLPESERQDFYTAMYVYFGIHGKTKIQKAMGAQFLNYGGIATGARPVE